MKKNLLTLLLLSFMALNSVFAQGRKITGKVTGADDGQPLPGVSVKVQGTSTGSQTNSDGTYQITVGANAKTLVFSFIGYQSTTVSVGNLSTINVRLSTDAKALTEVVVTGYTTTSKDVSTLASTKVSAEKINNVPVGSFDQILQGRVPGMSVMAGTGQPGQAANVVIRGYTTLGGASTAPLYVLDGIPIETSVFSTLNPNEFENVEVLKDAAATSLYGSRGANGVVVITSKKGKVGKTVFNYDYQTGTNQRTRGQFDMMTTQQILDFQASLKIGPGYALSQSNPAYAAATPAGKAAIDHNRDSVYSINTNWADVFLRKGNFLNHQVSASGGSDKTRFFAALGYYMQQGIAERSDLNRYNARLNLDHQSGKFKFGMQSALGFSQSNFVESEAGVALANPYAAAYLGQPYENPYDANGNIITSPYYQSATYPFPIYDNRTASNALSRIKGSTNKSNQLKETIGVNGSYQIINGLSVKTNLGLDFRETVGEREINPGTYGGSLSPGQVPSATNPNPASPPAGSYAQSDARNLQLIETTGLEYTKSFGKNDFYASVMSEMISNTLYNFNYTGYGINPKLLNTPAGITAGTAGSATVLSNGYIPVVGGGKTQSGINSFFAVVRNTYDGKYTISASIRQDESSQVISANKKHIFYSVGANWNLKKENFLADVNFIDALRLRGSYGTTATPFGTGEDANFGYLSQFGTTSYAGTQGIAPITPGNPNFNWEFTAQGDVGLEIELFKNRLTATIDVYNKNTNNLFLQQNLSYTSGFAQLQINAGTMRNRGLEIGLTADLIRSRNGLTVSAFANWAYNQNTITSLGQVAEYQSGTSIVRVGLPYGSHYTVKGAGVDPATGNYLYYNKDGSTTAIYNTNQSVAEFGTYAAPYQGGFGLNAGYKGFTVNSLFSYALEFSRFTNEDYFLTNPGNAVAYNQETVDLTMWRKPGDITTIGSINSQRQFNSIDVQDASFVRLRNLTVGYALPKSIISKVKFIQGLKLFVQGENLYVWTKWHGFDPEDSNNIATFEYPAAKTFTFGLNVSL